MASVFRFALSNLVLATALAASLPAMRRPPRRRRRWHRPGGRRNN